MKRYYPLVLSVVLLISGCGGVDWFPTTTSSGSTTAKPSITMAYSPGGVLSGKSSNITFTIANSSGNPAQSGLGFSWVFPTGLTVGILSPSQCAGTVTTVGGTQLVFSGGALASGTASCSITAVVTGTNTGMTTQTVPTPASGITGLAGLQSSASDQTLKVFPITFTQAFNGGTITVNNVNFSLSGTGGGSTVYTVTVDATNDTLVDATVTATVVAVDINGVDIPSTVTPAIDVSGLVPSGTTPTPLQLAAFPLVPDADAARILFWRIVSITAV